METTINVHPKKNTVQACRFLVYQDHPFPSIQRGSWEGGREIFPSYGHPPQGLGQRYRADLLRSDIDEIQRDGSRHDLAGFDGNPGGIVYRGHDLGEMSIEWDAAHPQSAAVRIQGFDCPTPAQKVFIMGEITPYLAAFAKAHAAELRRAAIAGLEKTLASSIKYERDQIDKAEAKAKKAIDWLKGGE